MEFTLALPITRWIWLRGWAYARAAASWTAVGEGPGAHTAFRFGCALVAGTFLQSGVSPVPPATALQDPSGDRAVQGQGERNLSIPIRVHPRSSAVEFLF